jgi:hypothetical protein
LVLDAGKLVQRYRAGDYEAVWRDLMMLGPDVRKPAYNSSLEAVAKETISRAKHNFELIVQRLHSLNYQFLDGYWHHPASKEELQDLAACERAGLLIPAAVRIFVEEMNIVSLLGTHPVLCPKGQVEIADPFWLGYTANFGWLLRTWREGRTVTGTPCDPCVIEFALCPGPESKSQAMNDDLADFWFSVHLPNAAADAILVGEPEGRTLVEYLRWSFKWGGFPGWEKQKARPEKELAMLREGLLPL